MMRWRGSSLHPAAGPSFQHPECGVRAALGTCGYAPGEQVADLVGGGGSAAFAGVPARSDVEAARRAAGADLALDQPRRRLGGRSASCCGGLGLLGRVQRALGAAEFAAQVVDQRPQARLVGRQTDTVRTPYCARLRGRTRLAQRVRGSAVARTRPVG